VLFDEEKYHLTKGLNRYPHEKESENTNDKMCSCFSEFFDEISSEHNDKGSDDSCREDSDNAIEYPISMHRYDICHSRSRESEWKGEWYDESLIEVFVDKMITFDFIDLCTIGFFSLHH
jgi:hypothetical protein